MAATVPQTPWSGRAANPGLFGLVAVTGAALFFGFPFEASHIVTHVVGAIVLLTGFVFLWVRVTVTDTDLTIDLGPLHLPRRSIPLSEIVDATVMEVRPMRYGGWGYRWCGRGCKAYVIRAGESLLVRRSNGKSVIVTVDDAATAAALVTSLIG